MFFQNVSFRAARLRSLGSFSLLIAVAGLEAAPSPLGTGFINNVSLGALADPSKVNRQWPGLINYDVNLSTWKYDVYVPPGYDGTKPYGVVVHTSSGSTGIVLAEAARDRNLIWISPRDVQNSQQYQLRYGASVLAFYRARELFNIDPRRMYSTGLSGGARIASALAFFHSELIRGTAPVVGFGLPRLREVTPDYLPETSSNTESYHDYSNGWFSGEDVAALNAAAIARKVRTYLITHYDDHREDYFVEALHAGYEPQGLTAFLYNGPGGHHNANDAEMRDAIDYLDRDDTFPLDARGANGFAHLANISQSGATAAATGGADSVERLTPTLAATAAVRSTARVYWDNRHGSTFRWLWEVKNAAPQNQRTTFGVWSGDETWGGGLPTSLAAAARPGILLTITQTAAGNRLVISARSQSGVEKVFYDGSFTFVPAYATAFTSPPSGYLTGTGSPVGIRLELNEKRFQIDFNGIALGTTTTIAAGTQVAPQTKRAIFGAWDAALGTPFWFHDPNTSWPNTWSPFTKSLFTATTGAVTATGAAPSPLDLRHMVASDPGLPDPPPPGPTNFTARARFGQIELAWDARVGATSYDVKRSGSPDGAYTTIQSNVTATAFVDASAAAGIFYYYTVSANLSSGPTANVTAVGAGLAAPRTRSTGGAATANAGGGSEGPAQAFDGLASTKWLNGGAGLPSWLQYRFPSGKRWVVTRYKITSANDVPGRDPRNWQVLGSHNGVSWDVVDTRTAQTFAERFQTNTYTAATPGEYEYYRLNVTANNGDATGVQLAEWELIGADTIPPALTTPGDIAVAATSPAGAVVTFTVSARDTGDGVVPARVTPASGSTFPIGVTTVIATSSDESGNVGQKTFTVTVTGPPPAPVGVSAAAGDGRVDLSWDAVAGAATYSVRRSLSGDGGYAVLASGLTAPSYADPTATNATTWYYTVSAANVAGASAESGVISATPIGAAQIVTPRMTVTNGTAQISLPTSVSGRTYQLQRSGTLAPGSWVNVGPAKAGGGALAFSDPPPGAAGKAFYRVLIGP